MGNTLTGSVAECTIPAEIHAITDAYKYQERIPTQEVQIVNKKILTFMKLLLIPILIIAVLVGCGKTDKKTFTQSVTKPTIDIWAAAASGNIKAINQHVAINTNLNAKEPRGGSTPLILSSIFGQTKAAKVLIEKGAIINIQNNDGTTALHAAAFFGWPKTVKLLLDNEANVNATNVRGETSLQIVSYEWNEELEGLYKSFGQTFGTPTDLGRIKTNRLKITDILRKHGGSTPIR